MLKNRLRNVKRVLAVLLAAVVCLSTMPDITLEAIYAEEQVDLSTATITASAVYTGNKIEIENIKIKINDVDVESVDLGDLEVEFSDPETQVINADTYANAIVITAKDSSTKYINQNTVDLVVEPIDLESVTLTAESMQYTGNEIVPVIKYGTIVLIESTDYTVQYQNSNGETITEIKDAGNYKLVITGIDNYKNEKTVDFTVDKIDISTLTLSIEDALFTNDEITALVVKNGGFPFADYSISTIKKDDVSVDKIKEVGEYKVTLAGENNYTGSKELSVKVVLDESINTDCLTIENAIKINVSEEYYYYYKNIDNEDVVIKAKDNYKIVGVNNVGVTVEDGIAKFSKSNNVNGEVKFTIKNETSDTVHTVADVGLKFVKDDSKPVVSIDTTGMYKEDATYTDESSNNWAKEIIKSLEITVSDNDTGSGTNSGISKVYYTIGDEEAQTKIECDEDGKYTIAKEKLNSDTTYNFYAVDGVGNVSEKYVLNIYKLDNTEPTITVKKNEEDESSIASGSTVYLNEDDLVNNEKKFTVTYEDIDDGVGCADNQSINDTYTKGMADPIKNEIVDFLGNKATHEFTVVYDDELPVISDFDYTVTDGIEVTGNSSGNYFVEEDGEITTITLTSDSVELSATVNDTNLEKVEFVKKDGESESATEVEIDANDGKFRMTVDQQKGAGIYYVRAYDKAGNIATSENSYEIKFVNGSMPAITEVTMSSGNESSWTNQDITFEITVEDENTTGKTMKFYYNNENPENDNAWHKFQGDVVISGNSWKLKYTEENSTFKGEYYFKAVNCFGQESNYKSVVVKKDKIVPLKRVDGNDVPVYVKYSSDDGKTNIVEKLIADITGRLFAKDKVDLTFYVYDEISGIHEFEVVYTDVEKGTLLVSAEATAVVDLIDLPDEIDVESLPELDSNHCYYKYEASIGIGEKSFSFGNLEIKRITDNAGNEIDTATVEQLKGVTEVVIDNIEPKLKGIYPSGGVKKTIDGKEYIFYKQENGVAAEQFKFEISDECLSKYTDADGNVIKPTVKVYNTNGVEIQEIQNVVNIEVNNNTAIVMIDLNYYSGSSKEDVDEVEYRIEISYKDGSGNEMIGENLSFGSVSSGKYTSGIIVLDNKAPVLESYTISGITERQVNNIDVYQTVGDKSIAIEFTIDDNDTYWDSSNASVIINNLSKAGTYSYDDIVWTSEGRKHTGKIIIKDAENEPSTYNVAISYVDVAGNKLIQGSNLDLKVEEGKPFPTFVDGKYTSRPFILDEKSPELTLSFDNRAYRLVKNSEPTRKNDIFDAVPENGYTAYYGTRNNKGNANDIAVTFTISDDYAIEKTSNNKFAGLEDFVLEIIKDGITLTEDLPIVNWTSDNGTYTGKFSLSDDGDYVIKLKYYDAAANKMVEKTGKIHGYATDNPVEDGIYTSEHIVLDNIAPVLNITYLDLSKKAAIPSREANGIRYFNDNGGIYYHIEIEDKNIRSDELKNELTTYNSYGVINDIDTKVTTDDINAIVEGTISTDKLVKDIRLAEANYEMNIRYEDLAGNHAIVKINDKEVKFNAKQEEYGNEFYIDKVTCDRGNDENKKDSPEFSISYRIEPTSVLEKIEYLAAYHFFANQKMIITVEAKDQISGIETVEYKVQGDTVDKTYVYKFKVFDGYSEDGNTACWTTTQVVPLEDKNFKGTVDFKVIDWAGNEANGDEGNIVESSEKHNDKTIADISLTTVSQPTRSVNGKDYYGKAYAGGSIDISMNVFDKYSGIRDVHYKLGSAELVNESKVPDSKGNKEITFEVLNQILKLDADSNNRNDVEVSAGFVDNAGNVTEDIKMLYNIDLTSPTIAVSFDNNNPVNGVYYKDIRTATVTITERNFNESDVVFNITNTHGPMPAISGWSHSGSGAGDDDTHTCTVTFADDGDYTFGINFMDMAGNEAEPYTAEPFTIDRTKPTYTVTYDNNKVLNEYYYDAQRIATIDILEHDFDPRLINVEINVTKSTSPAPSISGWSQNGDHNVATIRYSNDGEYTFDISGMDLAGNLLEDYAGDHFVVDTIAPELEIYDIENMSANNGVVMPGVRYSDINYDAKNSEIKMNGYHNGLIDMTGNGDITTNVNGVEIKLHDFEHVQEMDDLYTMNVTVYDLAGNSSEDSVIFSVNRFGSIYTFDDVTNALVGDNGKYYTNVEQNLVILETNVDTLEFKEITCNLNGELKTLVEGQDYTVESSGSDVSWKQYTYTINESNFKNEGTYLVTIYSEDRAKNTSNNSTKGKKIEFVVDKTSPSILISGITDGQQYRSSSEEVTLDVQDNVLLSKIVVDLNGKLTEYTAEQIEAVNGQITFNVDSMNSWQTMTVMAYDAAGNEKVTDEMTFLITSNIFIQYINNKTAVAASGVAVVAAGAIGFTLFAFKRRKRII